MEPITVLDQDVLSASVHVITGRGGVDPASRHVRGVSSLLASRDDLRGVHAFADVVEESVRWSA